MNISLDKLNTEGFIFHKYPLDQIDFNSTEKMVESFSHYISNCLSVKGEILLHDFDTISYDEEIKPHFHIIPGSFQVVIWLPKEEFKGRYFLFGNQKILKKTIPALGYMCFMKANDPQFIHGVSKLKSHCSISTLGFSSQVMKIDGNQDIFIDDYTIEVEETLLKELVK